MKTSPRPRSAPARPRARLARQVKAVFLVGFMGAGKTTVGKRLARRLGWRFIDLDDLIVARQGRSIAEIFADSGEPAFRATETEVLRGLLEELTAHQPAVVALGGGAFVQPENARMLQQHGSPVVFLDASLAELRRRCLPKGRARPLFQDANQFRQLYESRRSGYMAAGIRMDTTRKTVAQVAAELLRLLQRSTFGENS